MVIIETLHKFFGFLGTFEGELLKRSSEMVLFLIATYMIYIEYHRERKKEHLFLLISFATLSLLRMFSTIVLFFNIFGGIDIVSLGNLILLENIIEIPALFLLVNSFIYPLLQSKKKSNEKRHFLLKNTFKLLVVILIALVAAEFILKTPFAGVRFDILLIAFFSQIVMLYYGIYYILRKGGVVKYQESMFTCLLIYSITPLMNLFNTITLGNTNYFNDSLTVAAHPFPFLAVLLLVRLMYLRLADKATLMDKLRITKNKYEKEKELSEMKDDFISVVSHELKTPITSMKLFISMLKEGKLGPVNSQQTEALDVVNREGDRLNALINDVLTLSKLEAKKQNMAREKFNFHELINDQIYLNLAKEKGIKVDIDIPQDFVVNADPAMMKQVFINLFNNAIKFTDKGGKISLATKESEDKWQFHVTDTGKGISKESLPKLFNKFYQTENQMKRSKGGFGLGLSIVKHIVDLHEGKVNINSEIGKGTSFELSFPKKL